MLLKYQTISQQYHLEHHHSFCNRQSTLQTKGLFSNILSGKLQKQMCVPSMALFNTNSIFYCYYAMLCKLYSVVNCQMKKKKSEIYVAVESIFIYLIHINSSV